MRLQGKTALITGGNSGIGEATALLFAKEGAKVAIAARTLAASQKVADAITKAGGTALAVVCDVTNQDSVTSAAAHVVKAWGRIDILINNAGIGLVKTLQDTTDEEWDKVMVTNVKSIFYTGKAVIPQMITQGGGAIVNLASNLSFVAAQQYAAYSASKGAVLNLTRAMALDLAPHNIRVNCICPGPVDTPLLRSEFPAGEEGREAMVEFGKTHPLGRVSKPIEQAEAILFLASDASSYMTGAPLVIDGGFTAA